MSGGVKPEYAGVTLLAVTSAITAFSTFVPPLADVRHYNPADDRAGDVRLGEVAAAAMTLGVGAVASSVAGTGVPFAVAVLAAVVFVALYEWALQGKPFGPAGTHHTTGVMS
jgi:hypothetical protein